MISPANIAENYIALWNEQDAARRQDLLADGWHPDASYVDPLMQGRGHEGIAALVAAVHDRFPDHRFSLNGEADGHGDYVRFSWALAPVGGTALVRGTDFVRLEAGRLLSVTGFLDQVPAAP